MLPNTLGYPSPASASAGGAHCCCRAVADRDSTASCAQVADSPLTTVKLDLMGCFGPLGWVSGLLWLRFEGGFGFGLLLWLWFEVAQASVMG